MKRTMLILTVLLALVALPVFGSAYPNGVTQIGDPYAGRIYLGLDPIVQVNEGARTQEVFLTYESVLPGIVNLNWTSFTNLDPGIPNTYVEYGVFRAPHGTRVPNTQTDNEGVASSYTPAQLSTNIPPWEWVSTTGPAYGGGLLANTFQLTDVNASTQTDYWIYPIIQVGNPMTNFSDATYPMSSNYNVICIGCQTATPGLLQWVKVASAVGGNAPVNSVAVDSSGNVYATGYFSGSVDFGWGRSNSFPNATSGNIFLAKYSSAGVLTWLKIIATTNTVGAANETGRGVTVDSSGNVIITGGFANTVDFSGIGAAGATITSLANENVYVAKYQSDGTFVWAKRMGGTYSDGGYCVAVDSNNDVYMGGRMTSVNADYGGIVISAPGAQGICVVKLYGTNGATVWAKGLGGAAYNQLQGLAIATNGDVFITGYFMIGSSSLGGITLTNAGSADIFLGRLATATGNCIWSKRIGDTGGESGGAVAVDRATDNVIVTGGFNGTTDFGGGSIDTLAGGGTFLALYSGSTGAHLWSSGTGGSGDAGLGLASDSSGNLVLVSKNAYGVYWGGTQMVFGNGQISLTLAAFTFNGTNAPTWRWTKGVGTGSTGASAPTGVALDTSGHIFASGSFQSAVDFGGILGVAGASGYSSGFVNRYVR